VAPLSISAGVLFSFWQDTTILTSETTKVVRTILMLNLPFIMLLYFRIENKNIGQQ